MPFNRPIPESKQPAKASGALRGYVEAEKLMQIALLLPSSAFIGWLAGAWLDRCLHQEWIGLAGIVFGGVSGLVYVVRLALASAANSPKDTGTEDGNGEPGPGTKE
jgi:F0F1-type ATP synthase assembly protein I